MFPSETLKNNKTEKKKLKVLLKTKKNKQTEERWKGIAGYNLFLSFF